MKSTHSPQAPSKDTNQPSTHFKIASPCALGACDGMKNTPSCLAWLCGRGQAAPGGLAHIISFDPPASPSFSVLAKVSLETHQEYFVAFACPRNVYFSDAPLSHGDVLHLHFYRPPCVGRRDPFPASLVADASLKLQLFKPIPFRLPAQPCYLGPHRPHRV